MRILKSISAVLICIAILVLSVSCGDVTDPVTPGSGHVHVYDERYSKGNCYTLGKTEYYCYCGAELPPLYEDFYEPHYYQLTFTVDKEATPTSDGVESRHCINYEYCHSSIEARPRKWEGTDIKPGKLG